MSSSDIAITCRELSKGYQIYGEPRDRLKQFLLPRLRNFFGLKPKKYYREFWSLRGLSIDIKKGEMIGVIGRNGAGKSTFLQIICGTLNQSGGTVQVGGRIAALLELGSGFNSDFTGRENIYIYGNILGLTTKEVESRIQGICDFADIGDFIDQPLKTYSSGMYVRLAFSVAINVDPEILVVDEALAVGDAAFQYKCLRVIDDLRARGTTIILTTHDTATVKRSCDRALWLHEGRAIKFGDAVNVAGEYEDFLRSFMTQPAGEKKVEISTVHSEALVGLHARLIKGELLDARGSITDLVVTGSTVTMRITYEVYSSPQDGLVVGAAIFRGDDLYVCGLNTLLDNHQIPSGVGTHCVRLEYKNLSLLPGSYYIKLGVFDSSASVIWDFQHNASNFKVVSPYLGDGVALLSHHWING